MAGSSAAARRGRPAAASPPPAGHFVKRALGTTFSTGALGTGGFHSARKIAAAERRQNDDEDEPDRQPSHVAARLFLGARSPGRRPAASRPTRSGPAPIDDHGARYASTRSERAEREVGRRREVRGGDTRGRAGAAGVGGPGFVPRRTIVLVGLMGAGKTRIGRRIAARLELPFVDFGSGRRSRRRRDHR